MRTKRLLREMKYIAQNVIKSQYISDFFVHDTKIIITDKAKTPFVWQVRECGTWLYMLLEQDWTKRLTERLKTYEELKTENLYYIYDGNKFFPVFKSCVLETALDIEAKLIESYKYFINPNWHGLDVSQKVSLFDQGLLVKWMPKEKEWKCCYKSNIYPLIFSMGITSEKIIEELFTTGWAKKHIDSFMKSCSSTWEEWIRLPMVTRIDDLLGYFGANEIFGTDYSGGYTAKEICKQFHIKYDEDFENY